MGSAKLPPLRRTWLNVTEAARYMRTNEALCLLISDGQIPAYLPASEAVDPTKHVANSARRLVHVDDLDAWLRSHPATPRAVA